MKRKQQLLLILLFIFFFSNSFAEIPARKGWWKFDNPDGLTKAEFGFGLPLVLVGNQSPEAGPEDENGAVLIGVGSYYKMAHQISPKPGESKVNEYSLQYDFKINEIGMWRSFFQTSLNNADDGDLFINPGGEIGVAAVGYSSSSINSNEWYRLLVSVKNGSQFNLYLDGKLLLKGTIQPLNGRFSLEKTLLIFADDNGEDGAIYCSELSIWDKALTENEAAELGGFSHLPPKPKIRIPYLQSPGKSSMTVCWHDTSSVGTKVVYGKDSTNLNMETQGTSEFITDPYYWHTVRLLSLQSGTHYFYKVNSGDKFSETFSFKTLPDSDYNGKLRFVMLSDTHSSDTTMFGKIARKARSVISELYGTDIENQVTGIIHSGDIVMSGSSPEQYYKQFFTPLSALSVNIPTTVVAGNHEVESPYFYQYLKVDELSAYPDVPDLNEKILQLRVGNTLFLGLNTNITRQYGTTMTNWLNAKLKEAENNDSIDFVFLFFHHPPMSELWNYTNTQDEGTAFVRDVLVPVIKKYSKVQQLNYGHTHGFERGAIKSEKPGGDFRIICGGGGGGYLDPWAEGENRDFNEINICISNYMFQILEIDIAGKSYQSSVYSLGTLNKPKDGEMIDFWYKKINQKAPETPLIEDVILFNDHVQISTSEFSGIDSLMTVEIQASDSLESSGILMDTLVQKMNIYGTDNSSEPVDLNKNISMTQFNIPLNLLPSKSFNLKIRYRDNNLKWSNWSEKWSVSTTGIKEFSQVENNELHFLNFPNPFRNSTTFIYELENADMVTFRISDTNNRIVFEKNLGLVQKGTHSFIFSGENLSNGIYFGELQKGNKRSVRKVIKLE